MDNISQSVTSGYIFIYQLFQAFIFSKISSGSKQDIQQQRKRKAQSRSPSLEEDIDREERIAAEESDRILRSKKVKYV